MQVLSFSQQQIDQLPMDQRDSIRALVGGCVSLYNTDKSHSVNNLVSCRNRFNLFTNIASVRLFQMRMLFGWFGSIRRDIEMKRTIMAISGKYS